jgi:hypothetical protein
MKNKIDISKDFLIREYVEKKRASLDIAKELGISPTTVQVRLREFGIPRHKIGGQGNNLSGKTLGFLTILEKTDKRYGTSIIWKCQCICGKIVEKQIESLKRNKARSCGCRGLGRNNVVPAYFYCQIESHIKLRQNQGFECDIDYEFCCQLFKKQNGICALSGLPISFSKTSKDHSFHKGTTCSLDRIDSNLGYLKNNVQWVHKNINRMKWDYPEKYFIKLCNLISNYKCNNNEEKTETYNVPIKKWNRIKSKIIRPFEISFEQGQEQFSKQKGLCNLSGILLGFSWKTIENTASLDRINSKLDYIPGNIQWLHKDVNLMKGDFEQNYFLELCKTITKHNYKNQ